MFLRDWLLQAWVVLKNQRCWLAAQPDAVGYSILLEISEQIQIIDEGLKVNLDNLCSHIQLNFCLLSLGKLRKSLIRQGCVLVQFLKQALLLLVELIKLNLALSDQLA